ncbi:hypothetical protein N6H18_13215 [Reichenbachiella agarivorans]|uniref:PEP-CTERM protein-sorting domain-containing protein n=1 Tax=Reichenbachiella agarivorans TaxID=2979464 RepID=A0ABY6CLB6_9BACT|nr:hypothetical protein [Reichenbachiella agarivorans]UXP31308.1 hypothetical protein N6H18_13215 [Reichenbachiella agarivorans]
MNKKTVLMVLYWVLFSGAIWAFYVGLRSTTQQLEYTGLALVIWLAAFGVNWYMKRMKNH